MIVQNLEVYKLSLALAIDVYRMTTTFPKAETFGLVSQLRRAAASIPCNLAEGGVRNSPKEFAHFVSIARGSCAEFSTLITICEGIGYIERESEMASTAESIGKMLTALARSLRNKAVGGWRLAVGGWRLVVGDW